MPTNLLAIITNTFTETLRQPIYAVVIAAHHYIARFQPLIGNVYTRRRQSATGRCLYINTYGRRLVPCGLFGFDRRQ